MSRACGNGSVGSRRHSDRRIRAHGQLGERNRHDKGIDRFMPKQLIGRDKVIAPIEILQEGIRKGELKRMHALQAWWRIIGVCMFSLLSQEVIPSLASMMAVLPQFDSSNRKAQIVDLLMNGLTRHR